MRLIDADKIVTYQTIDVMNDEIITHKETIADALDELTDEGCPPTVSGWVSVKDRMPEPNVKCLIMDKTDVTVGTLIDKEKVIWQWQDSDFYARGGITYWMPLPTPPEVDDGSN